MLKPNIHVSFSLLHPTHTLAAHHRSCHRNPIITARVRPPKKGKTNVRCTFNQPVSCDAVRWRHRTVRQRHSRWSGPAAATWPDRTPPCDAPAAARTRPEIPPLASPSCRCAPAARAKWRWRGVGVRNEFSTRSCGNAAPARETHTRATQRRVDGRRGPAVKWPPDDVHHYRAPSSLNSGKFRAHTYADVRFRCYRVVSSICSYTAGSLRFWSGVCECVECFVWNYLCFGYGTVCVLVVEKINWTI